MSGIDCYNQPLFAFIVPSGETSSTCETNERKEESDAETKDTTITVNGHIFIPLTTALTYQEAKKACESRGTVLVTICNQQELTAIR